MHVRLHAMQTPTASKLCQHSKRQTHVPHSRLHQTMQTGSRVSAEVETHAKVQHLIQPDRLLSCGGGIPDVANLHASCPRAPAAARRILAVSKPSSPPTTCLPAAGRLPGGSRASLLAGMAKRSRCLGGNTWPVGVQARLKSRLVS